MYTVLSVAKLIQPKSKVLGDKSSKNQSILSVLLCTYQSFAPPPPIRANEGLDQGIRLKFCPQGRGTLFASINLLFYVITAILT